MVPGATGRTITIKKMNVDARERDALIKKLWERSKLLKGIDKVGRDGRGDSRSDSSGIKYREEYMIHTTLRQRELLESTDHIPVIIYVYEMLKARLNGDTVEPSNITKLKRRVDALKMRGEDNLVVKLMDTLARVYIGLGDTSNIITTTMRMLELTKKLRDTFDYFKSTVKIYVNISGPSLKDIIDTFRGNLSISLIDILSLLPYSTILDGINDSNTDNVDRNDAINYDYYVIDMTTTVKRVKDQMGVEYKEKVIELHAAFKAFMDLQERINRYLSTIKSPEATWPVEYSANLSKIHDAVSPMVRTAIINVFKRYMKHSTRFILTYNSVLHSEADFTLRAIRTSFGFNVNAMLVNPIVEEIVLHDEFTSLLKTVLARSLGEAGHIVRNELLASFKVVAYVEEVVHEILMGYRLTEDDRKIYNMDTPSANLPEHIVREGYSPTPDDSSDDDAERPVKRMRYKVPTYRTPNIRNIVAKCIKYERKSKYMKAMNILHSDGLNSIRVTALINMNAFVALCGIATPLTQDVIFKNSNAEVAFAAYCAFLSSRNHDFGPGNGKRAHQMYDHNTSDIGSKEVELRRAIQGIEGYANLGSSKAEDYMKHRGLL